MENVIRSDTVSRIAVEIPESYRKYLAFYFCTPSTAPTLKRQKKTQQRVL